MTRTSTIISLALAATIVASSADHYHVYLLGGQSNGNGRADAAQLSTPLDAPQTDVRFYWHRTQVVTNAGHLVEDAWIDLAPGSGCGTGAPVYAKEFGSEVNFGRTMADAKPAENIAIIKYTHGGTSLSGNWAAGGFQYTTFVSTVQAGLAALTTPGHTYDLKGMLWQQGEADTGGAAADNYEANLESLIDRVRTDLNGGEAFPFVIGSLSDSQYGASITTPGTGSYKVRQAQETVAATDPTVGIVITDGYSTRPGDSIHFDHTAQLTLGESFTERMLELENPPVQPTGRPNVIFILSDDQSWYDYSFMYRANVEKAALDANPAVKQVANTPAIDRLVDEGLTFTRGYSTPLCRPSLAALITGTYPHQSWVTGNDLVGDAPDQAVEARMQLMHPLPRTLGAHLGYTSFQTGKWWEGHHTNGGFTAGDTANSTAGGTAPSQWSGSKPGYVTARHGDWGLMTGRVDYVNDVAAPAHPIPYANTVETVTDFIDAQTGSSQPFFLWYAPFLPHTPHDPPAGLKAEYTALGLSSGDANYYANVERFDGGIGAILDHLDALGIADNTMVVMICDNGRAMSRGKLTPYEGGIRTPVVVRWPALIRAGGYIDPQIVTTPVSLIDLAPTVHAALGLPAYPEMTGVNLLDLGAVAARDTIFMEDNQHDIQDLPNPSASLEARVAIRDGWKLILSTGGGTELYHLYDTSTGNPVDPFENTNLSASNPTLVGELTTAITDWYDGAKGQQVNTTEAASFAVTSGDLLQTSLDPITPVTTTGVFTDVGGVTVTGEPALRNGAWDDSGGRGDTGIADGATATYYFDLTVSPLGYTIDQIDLYSNWGPTGDHDEIRVSIDYSVVGSPTNFDNHIVIEESCDPPTETQAKMSISSIGTFGVAALRFTWPAGQENGAVGYSEIDVFGSPEGSDTNPPVLSLLIPSDDGVHVPADDLVAVFSEPIWADAGFIRLYQSDDTLLESFDVASSPRVDVSGSQVVIDPTSDLVGGTGYYVQVDGTALKDFAGNSFGGIADTSSWSFIADGMPPGVDSTVPANGAGGVPPATNLIIEFDEDIQLGTGDITIHLAANGSVQQTIGVNGGDVGVVGSTVTIDPPSDLALDTAYYVNIVPGALEDLSGNAYSGIADSSSWVFTTTDTVLLHHWEFEGDATDSVGTHNGALVGDATFTGGTIGQALSLDGSGDSVFVNQSSLPASDFTLAAWVLRETAGDRMYVAGTQNSGNAGAFLRMDNNTGDGQAFVNLLPPGDVKRAWGGSVPLNTWTHLAVTVSSSDGIKIYVDGAEEAADPLGTDHSPNDNFRIGARPDGNTFGFDGLIDDVRIYGTALSAGEIVALAGGGGGGGDPSAVTSTVVASPAAVPADDTTTSTIRVTVKDDASQPVPARNVELTGSTGNATITAVSSVTDVNGEAVFTVRSGTAGAEVFTASDVTGGGNLGINQTAAVDFQSSTPASGLLFYEGFDYPAGDLDGNGGWSVAAGGTQVALNGATTDTYSGTYSSVTTSGGYIHNSDGSNDFASVVLGSSVTSTFTDGSVTWLSFINIRGTNGANARGGLAIGADALTGARWGGAMAGDGIGITAHDNNADEAAYWTDADDLNAGGTDIPGGTGRDRFNIAKITWSDSGNDTIEWAFFDAGATITEGEFDLKSRSTASADLDQSTFDTLSIASGYMHFDEIRIATTFDDAVNGTVISTGNTFTAWISNPAFGLAQEDQEFALDPDGDRIPNGVEAWFGTHPGEFSKGLVGLSADGSTTTFSHPQNEHPPEDLAGFYEWSHDLSGWYAADGVDGPAGGPAVTIGSNTVGTTTTVTATASEAMRSLFLRAGVSQDVP